MTTCDDLRDDLETRSSRQIPEPGRRVSQGVTTCDDLRVCVVVFTHGADPGPSRARRGRDPHFAKSRERVALAVTVVTGRHRRDLA